MRRIIVLDTPAGDLASLAAAFGQAGGDCCQVRTAGSVEQVLARMAAGPVDLVVLDYRLGDGRMTGRQALAAVRKADTLVPLIAVAEQGNVELAAEAIDAGASDFLVRGDRLPERVSTLIGKIRNLLDLIDANRALRAQNLLLRQEHLERYHIIGESPQIIQVLQRIARVARIPRPVLIIGERGTGKELVARAIHEASGRAGKPFVVINCAAAAETLLESELFGHEKGAFTGADTVVQGKFEQADGGTLFLDEIGNMSLPFQQKILRAVEYGSFMRIGGQKEIRTSARILAATNADLQSAIREGQFLQDLYDRLSFEVIHVPPLRQREGDVEILARHFLRAFMREIPALRGKRLSSQAIEVLRRYPFPGNVREMKNIIERAAYRDTENEITPADIDMPACGASSPKAPAGPIGDVSSAAAPAASSATASSPPAGATFEAGVEAYRKRLILDALAKANNNQAAAARSLGLSYHQYRYHLRKYSAGQ